MVTSGSRLRLSKFEFVRPLETIKKCCEARPAARFFHEPAVEILPLRNPFASQSYTPAPPADQRLSHLVRGPDLRLDQGMNALSLAAVFDPENVLARLRT